jgi:hypothetical protein
MGRRLPGDRDPLGPAPGPGPIGPRPPRPPFPPIPWTPFGPGDNATPDVAAIEGRAAGIRAQLEKVQRELTGMRYGPGPDGTPPVVREVTRADGLWPFLVIRTYPGDMGKRPFAPSDTVAPYSTPVNSPDVILTPLGPSGEPVVVGRSGMAAVKGRELHSALVGMACDLWVHVWNLGRFQATGVRVRAYVEPSPYHYPPQDPWFAGGTTIDLSDRERDPAHLMVKVGTFLFYGPTTRPWMMVTATAECLTDPATGDRSPGADRHCAHCVIEVTN